MEEGEESEGSGAGDRAAGITGGGGRGFFMEPFQSMEMRLKNYGRLS